MGSYSHPTSQDANQDDLRDDSDLMHPAGLSDQDNSDHERSPKALKWLSLELS